jgi:hypothetical protein
MSTEAGLTGTIVSCSTAHTERRRQLNAKDHFGKSRLLIPQERTFVGTKLAVAPAAMTQAMKTQAVRHIRRIGHVCAECLLKGEMVDVRIGSEADMPTVNLRCPRLPRKQTLIRANWMSAKGQSRHHLNYSNTFCWKPCHSAKPASKRRSIFVQPRHPSARFLRY